MNLADEEIAVALGNLGVSNVDHAAIDEEVHLRGRKWSGWLVELLVGCGLVVVERGQM